MDYLIIFVLVWPWCLSFCFGVLSNISALGPAFLYYWLTVCHQFLYRCSVMLYTRVRQLCHLAHIFVLCKTALGERRLFHPQVECVCVCSKAMMYTTPLYSWTLPGATLASVLSTKPIKVLLVPSPSLPLSLLESFGQLPTSASFARGAREKLYCQAQSQLQLGWTELALISVLYQHHPPPT